MQIEFKPLKPLFILYAALNANGYDQENAQAMHPVRLAARQFLAGQEFPPHDFKWNPYQYTKQVLLSDNLKPTPQNNPDFAQSLEYLRQFEKEAKLEDLWPNVQQATEMALNEYRREASDLIERLKSLIELAEPSKRIVISVNLLESYYRGFSITTDDAIYLVTGPSGQVNLRNILHELLHAYLKKTNIKYEADETTYTQIAADLKVNYPIDTIAEESLVRALVVYLGRQLKIDQTELSEQDKKLIFPEILLNKLEGLKPEKITTETLSFVLK